MFVAMQRRALPVILAAFVLSVLLRLPLLDRPLSAHHEFCTAITLITLQNWWTDGIAAHAGAPTGVFVQEARTFLPAQLYDPNEQALALYYFSHPPLAFDLPYALFVLTGTPPNALGLQLFNVFFHLVTTLCLAHGLKTVLPATSRAPLYTAVLYLFMPGPLWFHSNAYMGDIFVQNTWVLHLLAALLLFHRNAPLQTRRVFLFTITLFLAVLTSWLGVLAGLTSMAYAAWKARRQNDRRWWGVMGWAALAMAAALGYTAWRYLHLVDLGALLRYYAGRYAVRGTTGPDVDLLGSLRQLVLMNYRLNYLPVIALLVALSVVRWIRRAGKDPQASLPWLFVVLAGLPVLLDHALLLPYAEHDFAALKGGPLLCALGGMALARLRPTWSIALLVLTCAAGVGYFYRTNPLPGHDGGRYAMERDLGLAIAHEARADEVVFLVGPAPEPQVLWYAKRTVLGVDGLQQAQDFLRERGLSHGIVFQPEPDGLRRVRISVTDSLP